MRLLLQLSRRHATAIIIADSGDNGVERWRQEGERERERERQKDTFEEDKSLAIRAPHEKSMLPIRSRSYIRLGE